MSKSEEPTTHKDWCLSFYRRPCNCGAEQPSTPPSPEEATLKAKLLAYEILLTSTSWGAAYGAVCEDYPELVEQVEAYAEAKNRAQVEEIAEQIERAGMIPSATVEDIVDAYLFSKEQLKACSDLRDSEAEEAAEEIEELKKMIAERNAMYEGQLERADVRAESLELQLSEQRALMGDVESVLQSAIGLAGLAYHRWTRDPKDKETAHEVLCKLERFLAKLGKKNSPKEKV